jgi:hypothetical protein
MLEGGIRALALRGDLDGEHVRRPASGGCRLARPRRRWRAHRALGDRQPSRVPLAQGPGERRRRRAHPTLRPACTPSACASNTAAPPTPSAASATTPGCSQRASSRFASKLRILLCSRRSRQRHEKCQGRSSAPRASPDVSSARHPPRLAGSWIPGSSHVRRPIPCKSHGPAAVFDTALSAAVASRRFPIKRGQSRLAPGTAPVPQQASEVGAGM